MSLFEEDLREALRQHAGDAPDSRGLLTAVRARSRRTSYRIRLAATGAPLAVLVVLAAAFVATPPGRDGGERSGAGCVPASTPAPAPSGPAPSGKYTQRPSGRVPVTLAGTGRTWADQSFPFTPRYHPVGLGNPFPGMAGGIAFLRYEPLGDRHSLLVEVATADRPEVRHDAELNASAEPVIVQGRAGWLYQSCVERVPQAQQLIWQHGPDVWVTISASGLDGSELLRYADGLAAEPIPVTMPFEFRHAPAGLVLGYADARQMAFTLPGGVTTITALTFGFPVDHLMVTLAAPGDHAGVEELSVGGRRAWLIDDLPTEGLDYQTHLFVQLDSGHELHVSLMGLVKMARADLITFAEGISTTAAVRDPAASPSR